MEAAARGAPWHRRHGPGSSSCHHPAAPAHPSASNPASLASEPSAAPAVARQSRSWHGASDSGATASCPGDSGTGRGQLVQPGAAEQTWPPGMCRCHRSFESAQMSPKGAWHNARPAQGLLSCFEDQAGQMGGHGGVPQLHRGSAWGRGLRRARGEQSPRGTAGQGSGGVTGMLVPQGTESKASGGGGSRPLPRRADQVRAAPEQRARRLGRSELAPADGGMFIRREVCNFSSPVSICGNVTCAAWCSLQA